MREDGKRLIEISGSDRFKEFTMSELAAIHHESVHEFWSLKDRYRFIATLNQSLTILNTFTELGRSLDRILASKHLGLIQSIYYMPDCGFDQRCTPDDVYDIFRHEDWEVKIPDSDGYYCMNPDQLSDLLEGKPLRSCKHEGDDVDSEISKVARYHQQFVRSDAYLNHIFPLLEKAKLNYLLPYKKTEPKKGVVKI